MKCQVLCLSLLLLAPSVFAEDSEVINEAADAGAPIEAPLPPTLPPQLQSGEALEPEVTIRKDEEKVVEEYRMGGRLYMVKITPSVGPAYYLIDSDGDGELDVREDDITNSAVPQWVLFRW
jgi:hypothetical protein